MDHKEQKHEFHQPIGLCYKLYNFMKFLPTHLLKLLTSSWITPPCVADAPGLNATRTDASSKPNNAQVVPSIAQENPPREGEDMESKTYSDVPITTSSTEEDALQVVEDADIDAKIQVQPEEAPPDKAPKKMVSINETVETIKTSKKRNKELKQQEAEQQMPLKSILKVPSDASNSQEPQRLLSRANGA
ncbi:hypothetical protein Pint_19967 [Pistacia integerrima]|uniref:Uncharacterized protein n=1 Tax=Pistacia integerrima TaxID=434235 RepID=A0ACC0X7Y9_9ROSI|nr:hypothetical protein Pint_19967 [Pistacia integerrima]